MKPTLGRIVLVTITTGNNGATEAPAIITRVWSDQLVNVRVQLDGQDTPWLTSIPLHADRAELEAAGDKRRADWLAAGNDLPATPGYVAAYWPPRVGA